MHSAVLASSTSTHASATPRPFAAGRARLRVQSSPSSRPIVRANAGGLGGGFSAALDRLRREAAEAMQGVAGAAPSSAGTLVGVSFADDAPSWDALEARVAELRAQHGLPVVDDLENGPANPKALLRRFDSSPDDEPRVLFYRDHAAWCPYCQKIWMQLEEKRIPYRVEKINMRCYGDKKPSFTAKVPSGMLPVMEIDGVLITDSAAIAAALEREFPETPLLPEDGTPERARASDLLKLERALFSRWMGWLTSGWADGQNRSGFEEALDIVDAFLNAQFEGGRHATRVDMIEAD